MRINRFFIYLGLACILTACGTNRRGGSSIDWTDIEVGATTGSPSDMYGRPSDGYGTETRDTNHSIAVLLPLSGPNASVGETIRTSVIMAVLSNAPDSLSVSFFDTNENLQSAFDRALETAPEIIIGPVFSDNTRIIRDIKPYDLPVLSFTSDTTALGDGVITTALIPTNGIETIVREISADKTQNLIIIAPDTQSGHLMAGAAKSAAHAYKTNLNGVFYYQESNPDSIKEMARTASMHQSRTAAHTRAREVISDILTNEQLNMLEKSSLNNQLEKLSKTETLGTVPYDAILFLGNGNDTKTIASFLRYYDVSATDARFYGTTMWDGSDIASDLTMSGAKFATLSPIRPTFSGLYEQVSGTPAGHLASFGYDAASIAIGALYSAAPANHLFNPNGYIGTNGLFRLKPTGDNERALRILQLNATGTPVEVKSAPQNFINPLYKLNPFDVKPVESVAIKTSGFDPDNYIQIPERLKAKYSSRPFGANTKSLSTIEQSKLVAILPDAEGETIKSENYTPIKQDTVQRTYIEEYEITEEQ